MKLEHNWKSYKWIGDKWGCLSITKEHKIIVNDFELVELIPPESIVHIITHHTPDQLIKLGYLEEVKENKDSMFMPKYSKSFQQFKDFLKEYRSEYTEYAEDDPDRAIYDFLTSLENSSEIPNSSTLWQESILQWSTPMEQDEEPIGSAWEWWTPTPWQEDFSELPKINDTNLLEDVCVWTPKPWQEIEVSNDNNKRKWEVRKYSRFESNDDMGFPYETVPLNEFDEDVVWKFARPLEQVTIPEFDYDKIHMEAMKDHVGSFATHVAHPLCKQMSEITQFLHSQFPNSSPISKMETTQFTPWQEEQVILPEGAIPRFLHSQFPNNKPWK